MSQHRKIRGPPRSASWEASRRPAAISASPSAVSKSVAGAAPADPPLPSDNPVTEELKMTEDGELFFGRCSSILNDLVMRRALSAMKCQRRWAASCGEPLSVGSKNHNCVGRVTHCGPKLAAWRLARPGLANYTSASSQGALSVGSLDAMVDIGPSGFASSSFTLLWPKYVSSRGGWWNSFALWSGLPPIYVLFPSNRNLALKVKPSSTL